MGDFCYYTPSSDFWRLDSVALHCKSVPPSGSGGPENLERLLRKGRKLALNNGFEYREQINPGGSGKTVLAYLAERYPHSSEADWKVRLDGGGIYVNGRRAGEDDVLTCGQQLLWRRPPWNEPDAPLCFTVLYEDEQLLAVGKPGGLPTIPGGGFLDHTLLALVRKRCPEATPVHRLGRATSGVVLFARTADARSSVCASLRRREVSKNYRGLACGEPVCDRFVIEAPIGPLPHPILGTVYGFRSDGKPALSRVRVIERREKTSLLSVVIETGRPHQIRIHLAYAGHPLAGDPLYESGGGIKDPAALPGDSGYLLHAQSIRLLHPKTGQEIEISCPAPRVLRTKDETAGPDSEDLPASGHFVPAES
ncbi:MAG: RluA family pseudouridine synthase [Desulfobacteraceae bacterium]|nr:RluA family pseudouridine synthase [Desulfobacteraceae bacterium]